MHNFTTRAVRVSPWREQICRSRNRSETKRMRAGSIEIASRLGASLSVDPEHVEAMVAAFEQVSLELGLTQRADGARDLVAQAIIDCAQRGIRKQEEMSRCAHQALQTM